MAARAGLLTEASARKHINKIYKAGVGDSLSFHTIKGWLEWWVENKAKAKRKGTADRYAGSIKSFIEVIGDRADLDIRHLSQVDAEAYRSYLMKSGKSNSTVNVDVKTVAAAINLARSNGLIDNNPFASLDLLPVAPSEKKHFDEEQLASIFKHARGEWLGVCLFGYFTGLRISDITQLQWGAIELEGEVPLVRFKEIKKQDRHRREIIVPLHPSLAEYLLGLTRGAETDFLFPELQTKGTGGNKGLSQSFKRILLAAGIIEELYQKKKKGSVARKVSPYSFHSFRHTFKTVLANKGVGSDVRDVLTGHAKPSVAEAYVHRDQKVLADAVSLLPALEAA